GPKQNGELLACVAGGHLARSEVSRGRDDRDTRLHPRQMTPEPAPVWLPRGKPALDLHVRLEPAARRIDGDHLSGAELAATHATALEDVHRARLRRADDEISHDRSAKWAQAV